MAIAALPSGRQYEIRYGDQRATVVEVGGALREYVVGDRPVLDGYAESEMCDGARGQSLLPWPNRIKDGRYRWAGTDQQLPITEVGKNTAIHGLARWLSWTATEEAADRVTMACTVHPHPGYPFTLDLSIGYVLAADGLTVTTSATNASADPCPYGAGAHPYLTVATEVIDTAVVRIPGRTHLPVDERGIPTGRERVAGTAYDFMVARTIGETEIDVAYTGLERDDDGLARVVLQAPDGTVTVALWVDGHYPHLEIFTGDTLAPHRRRRGLGVEPMTCPPNAFATGEDVISLAPGQTVVGRWGITPSG